MEFFSPFPTASIPTADGFDPEDIIENIGTWREMAIGHKRRRSQDEEGNSSNPIVHAADTALAGQIEDQVEEKPPKKKLQRRRSLFVRSLPASATTDKLVSHFSQSYPIKHATAVIDSETNICKGYGFITFADAEDAQRALEEFNGSIFEGKKINIEIAEPRNRDLEATDSSRELPKKERPEGPAHHRGRTEHNQDGEHQDGVPKLIIRNLPWSIKKPLQLEQLFMSYGKIKSATIPMKKPGLLRGFGFVVMRGRKNAEKAIEGVNGKVIDGRTLAVDWAVDKDTWKAQLAEGENGMSHEEIASGDAEKDASDKESSAEQDSLQSEDEDIEGSDDEDGEEQTVTKKSDHSSTLFIRNVSFDTTDELLASHFAQFGRVRYARVVMDPVTERSKGSGFVCFQNVEDAQSCLRKAPKTAMSSQPSKNSSSDNQSGPSILENLSLDPTGAYTLDSRVLNISQAVDRDSATRLATESFNMRTKRDSDKRRIYLLTEGTISPDSPLHSTLSASEIAMRDASLKQRRALLQSNPSLNLSLTRLSVRNVPRSIGSKELKALAREAVVGFAKDVKEGRREKLSKEELERGANAMEGAEKLRKEKGVGIVKQAKVVFEGREGGKVDEKSGAGRSRGYGFIEYYTHRNALMGLRWLNGYAVDYQAQAQATKGPTKSAPMGKEKRLIVEFAIENAQVVNRRRDRETRSRGGSTAGGKGNSGGGQEATLDEDVGGAGKETKGPKKSQIKSKEGIQDIQSAEKGKQAQRARIIMKKRAARRDRRKTVKGRT